MSPIQSGTVLLATGHEQEVSKKKKDCLGLNAKLWSDPRKGPMIEGKRKTYLQIIPRKKRYNLNSNHISELTLKSLQMMFSKL